MKGITELLGHKKSSLALIAMLIIALSDTEAGGATFFASLTDTQLICITSVVVAAIVSQAAVDVVTALKGKQEQ